MAADGGAWGHATHGSGRRIFIPKRFMKQVLKTGKVTFANSRHEAKEKFSTYERLQGWSMDDIIHNKRGLAKAIKDKKKRKPFQQRIADESALKGRRKSRTRSSLRRDNELLTAAGTQQKYNPRREVRNVSVFLHNEKMYQNQKSRPHKKFRMEASKPKSTARTPKFNPAFAGSATQRSVTRRKAPPK